MTWRVTYRVLGRVETAELTPAWAHDARVDPARLASAEGAAWAFALARGSYRQRDDLELIAVTGTPETTPWDDPAVMTADLANAVRGIEASGGPWQTDPEEGP